MNWDDLDFFFIVSTGRTGTRYLAEFFGRQLPAVAAFHEPAPNVRPIGLGYASGALSEQSAALNLVLARANALARLAASGQRGYVESNGVLVWLVPVLLRVFPRCKVLHVVRDPRTLIRSALTRRPPGTPEAAWGTRATFFPDDPHRTRWPEMTNVERFGWVWAKKNASVLAMKGHADVRTVRFEDLFDVEAGCPGLQEAIDFFEVRDRLAVDAEGAVVDVRRNVSNESGRYSTPPFEAWSAEEQEGLLRYTREAMEAFGYGS